MTHPLSPGFHRLGSQNPNWEQTHADDIAALMDVPNTDTYTTGIGEMPRVTISPIPAIILESEHTAPKMDIHVARSQGYTGSQCSNCNSLRMKTSGHCEVCEECGTTTGCS